MATLLPFVTPDARLYILDRWHNLLPEGIPGEVYLAGVEASSTCSQGPVADPFEAGRHLVPTGRRARLVAGRAETVTAARGAEAAAEDSAVPHVAPRSSLEVSLADIYSQVLGADRVGIHEDFFALGGNSLLAAQLALALRRELASPVPLRWIFEAPTVAELRERIERGGMVDGC